MMTLLHFKYCQESLSSSFWARVSYEVAAVFIDLQPDKSLCFAKKKTSRACLIAVTVMWRL